MSNVRSLDDHRPPADDDPLECGGCGGQWFNLVMDDGAGAVTFNREWHVTGFAGDLHCRDCGRAL